MSFMTRLLREQDGQDMVEYGLLAGFISIIAIAAIEAISPLVNQMYVTILNSLP